MTGGAAPSFGRFGRRGARLVGVWVVLCLVISGWAVAVHGGDGSSSLAASGGPPTSTATSSTSPTTRARASTTDSTTSSTSSQPSDPPAPSTPSAPASSTTTPNAPAAATSGDDDGVGSALDLAPGPIERSAPVPCVDESQVPDRSKLVVIDVNRRCVRVLATEQDWVGRELTWSPDGSWLLATINANLVRVAADGSWRQSLGGSQQVEEAVLSPDGTLIAVTGRIRCCYKSQKPALIIVDVDGTNAHLVRGDHPEGMAVDPGTQQERGYRGGVPSWSPDSRRLAYVHVAPEPIDYPEVSVRIMNLDGADVASRSFPDRGPRDLESGRRTPATFGSPEWTPDGGLVATTFMEDPEQFLYWFTGTLRDAPGPTNPPSFVADDSIDLSPDGRRLLFEGVDPEALEDGHTPQVRVVNRADGKVRVLADRAMAPSWSPAGDRLAYATTRTERDRINIARTITVGDMAGNTTPLWTVDDYGCECWLHAPPIWSPDGSRIAVTTKG